MINILNWYFLGSTLAVVSAAHMLWRIWHETRNPQDPPRWLKVMFFAEVIFLFWPALLAWAWFVSLYQDDAKRNGA